MLNTNQPYMMRKPSKSDAQRKFFDTCFLQLFSRLNLAMYETDSRWSFGI